jgi:hypothetical protein
MQPNRHGFLLPFSFVTALILLTSAGFWYQQTVVQSKLEGFFLEKHLLYMECNSLIPFLVDKLKQLPANKLKKGDSDFQVVQVESVTRWRISRSSVIRNRVQFIFQGTQSKPPIKITITYTPNSA